MFGNLFDSLIRLQDDMTYPTIYLDCCRDHIILTEVRIILEEFDKVARKNQVIALNNAVFWGPDELKKSGKV